MLKADQKISLVLHTFFLLSILLICYYHTLVSGGRSRSTSSQLKEKAVNVTCPLNLIYRTNEAGRPSFTLQEIPPIIHQTASSRCLTKKIYQATSKWRQNGFEDFEYRFYDDEDIRRIFSHELNNDRWKKIATNCLIGGAIRADVWRYLMLWKYGGIYADIDSAPAKLTPDLFLNTDALFVVEQYHILSQWFMAVSPRHPLMKLALEQALENMFHVSDVTNVGAAKQTGPHALHVALQKYMPGVFDPLKPGNKPVKEGTYVGGNRSITVIGVAEHQNEFVQRDVIRHKNLEYASMNMVHFSQDRRVSGVSCRTAIAGAIKVESP